MQTIELLVSLKIPDVTALTAASSIRRRLGYNEVLKELRRSDYYSLDLNTTDPQVANELAHELAEKTNLFVNPNKHSYEVRSAQDRGGSTGHRCRGSGSRRYPAGTDPAAGLQWQSQCGPPGDTVDAATGHRQC